MDSLICKIGTISESHNAIRSSWASLLLSILVCMKCFEYRRTRKQTAKSVALSLSILPIWYFVFQLLGRDKSGIDEFLSLVAYSFAIVAAVLIGYITWLLRNPAVFEVLLTRREFRVHHPTSKTWSFSVNPDSIERIEHRLVSKNEPIIIMRLRGGAEYNLCRNYNYSLKKLYAALALVNPKIDLPENTIRFTRK